MKSPPLHLILILIGLLLHEIEASKFQSVAKYAVSDAPFYVDYCSRLFLSRNPENVNFYFDTKEGEVGPINPVHVGNGFTITGRRCWKLTFTAPSGEGSFRLIARKKKPGWFGRYSRLAKSHKIEYAPSKAPPIPNLN